MAVATWVPPRGWSFGDEPAEYRCGGEPVAWRLDAGRAREMVGRIGGPRWGGACQDAAVELGLPHVEAGGALCGSIWETMAASYAGYGIRVNAIAPGGTATERIVASFARRGHPVPTGEGPGIPPLGQPADIAEAAVFLASDESRMVTGVVLSIDGGMTSIRRLPARPEPVRGG